MHAELALCECCVNAERAQGRQTADIRQPQSEHGENDDQARIERRPDTHSLAMIVSVFKADPGSVCV
jgi:hypothetical protein